MHSGVRVQFARMDVHAMRAMEASAVQAMGEFEELERRAALAVRPMASALCALLPAAPGVLPDAADQLEQYLQLEHYLQNLCDRTETPALALCAAFVLLTERPQLVDFARSSVRDAAFAATIVSAKLVLERSDVATNAFIAMRCGLTLRQANYLELRLLAALDFDARVSRDELDAALRTLCPRDVPSERAEDMMAAENARVPAAFACRAQSSAVVGAGACAIAGGAADLDDAGIERSRSPVAAGQVAAAPAAVVVADAAAADRDSCALQTDRSDDDVGCAPVAADIDRKSSCDDEDDASPAPPPASSSSPTSLFTADADADASADGGSRSRSSSQVVLSTLPPPSSPSPAPPRSAPYGDVASADACAAAAAAAKDDVAKNVNSISIASDVNVNDISEELLPTAAIGAATADAADDDIVGKKSVLRRRNYRLGISALERALARACATPLR